jgi:hypothetical protein
MENKKEKIEKSKKIIKRKKKKKIEKEYSDVLSFPPEDYPKFTEVEICRFEIDGFILRCLTIPRYPIDILFDFINKTNRIPNYVKESIFKTDKEILLNIIPIIGEELGIKSEMGKEAKAKHIIDNCENLLLKNQATFRVFFLWIIWRSETFQRLIKLKYPQEVSRVDYVVQLMAKEFFDYKDKEYKFQIFFEKTNSFMLNSTKTANLYTSIKCYFPIDNKFPFELKIMDSTEYEKFISEIYKLIN